VPRQHAKLHSGVSLAGCILCFITLAVYCGYQVGQGWMFEVNGWADSRLLLLRS
jgi:hypothetical protein